MTDCTKSLSPLVHGGTSQGERRLAELSNDYVGIDENEIADWIVFASEFSKFIAYYGTDGSEPFKGWQAFFSRDISAILGSFAVQDIEQYRLELGRRLAFLRDDGNAGDEDGLRANLSEAFSMVLTLVQSLDTFHLRLPAGVAFKTTLGSVIATKLAAALRRLLAYLKGAAGEDLYRPIGSVDYRILNTKVKDAMAIASASAALSTGWFDAENPDFASIEADVSVYQGLSTFDKLSHAANHFLFCSAFDSFTQAYARLIVEAEAALEQTLQYDDGHQPHYALFLAFLKLFRTSRDKLNELTGKHLDFYYREVLRLTPKAALPDQVHLIAELAKSRESAALDQGTLFKADKDSERKDRFYALTAETTFNRAKVASLMALYRAETEDPRLAEDLRNSGRMFAAPVMNSADGVGGEITSEMGDWHPLLNATANDSGIIEEIAMPAAEIGFGVSSHYLFLAEGLRTITLFVETSEPFSTIDAQQLRCRLSGEKGWFDGLVTEINDCEGSFGGLGTEIVVVLTAAAPAVTAIDAKVHGAEFQAGLPAMQLLLVNRADVDFGYDALKNVSIKSIELKVTVGTGGTGFSNDGLRLLTLAGKDGGLDPSKPFMPWGAVPRKDAPFIMGSAEMFGKSNAVFNLDIAWSNRPATLSPAPDARLQFLQGGAWVDASSASTGGSICKSSTQRTFTSAIAIPAGARVAQPGIPAVYSASSRSGFLRLILDGDFGHKAYANEYLEHAVKYNKWVQDGEPTGQQPDDLSPEPYTPTIDAISCSYTATSGAIDPGAAGALPVRFYHVGPFGIAEQKATPAGSSVHWLAPQFRFPEQTDHTAEWYIGLENLSARQSVNILVQVLEGSTLPLLSKPQSHLTWSYWAGNQWVAFEKSEIRDGTQQLTRSGILSFAIPDDATIDEGIMPHGLLWLMASVTEAVGAVCRLLRVEAQALHATFEDHGNAADAMDQPLSAETIKKPRVAAAAFKKFRQPYCSYGGRPKEGDEAFYLRCSERLRHKGRGSTIWDYERLVLEAFPQIHRVKCLHHTRIEDNPNASLAIHNENAPGYVSLITLPDLNGRNDTELLKPYTHQGVLGEIKAFLLERVSGQLAAPASGPRVCVCNPLFEEIYLQFKLQLAEGYDDFTYYAELLAEELTRFLSPWAFSDSAPIPFGGQIPKSSLVDFIDERPYVDFITDLIMRHKPEGGALSEDLEIAAATTSRSILVSAPPSLHKIDPHESSEASS